ncbi:MAG: type II secretion system F family protein [Candidatus Theseobacter exili]|nr:type II secretion system F family protein [Candidatus Theseobacter exili]
MPVYIYNAYDSDGSSKQGSIEAENQIKAKQLLKENGLFITSVTESVKSDNRFFPSHKVGLPVLARLFRRLADLLNNRFSLIDSLKILQESERDEIVKSSIVRVREKVQEGRHFFEAIQSLGGRLSNAVTKAVNLSEAACGLATGLDNLASILETNIESRRRIVNAIIYPAILVSVSLCVLVFLLTAVVPMVEGVFLELGQKLPFLTTCLIGLSESIIDWWFVYVFGCILIFAVIWRMLYSEKIIKVFIKIALKVPLIGNFLKNHLAAIFAGNMSLLLESGVSLEESLSLSGKLSGNRFLEKEACRMSEAIIRGANMTSTIRNTIIFPDGFLEALEVGERSGMLAEAFKGMACWCEKESRFQMDRIIAVTEPVCILVVGGFVGLIAFSVLLPILQLNTLVQ